MNEEVLHFIPWDIKDRMFAQLQKKIIRTYLKKKEKKKKKIYPWCCNEPFGRKKAKLPNTLLVEHYAGRVTLPYWSTYIFRFPTPPGFCGLSSLISFLFTDR